MSNEVKTKLEQIKIKKELQKHKCELRTCSLLRLMKMEQRVENTCRKINEVSKNYISCVLLHNAHLAIDPKDIQKEILQGRYDLIFPISATEFSQKFEKALCQPMCFYM